MIDGLLVVDKPAGWTSHDVVARCRRVVGQKRVGHSGTLDPDATGVLLVGCGAVTRLLRFLTDLPKQYVGEVVLGTATSTLDAAGEVTGAWDMSTVGVADVEQAAAAFVGEIDQVPPMVSAVQVGGKRLHELARQGIEVERKARRVTVHSLAVTAEVEPGVFGIDVRCSSGTYIRTLAADIGTALGGGAHLRKLRRTAIGSFDLSAATPLEALAPTDVLSPVEALRDYPLVEVDAEMARLVGNGRPVDGLGAGGVTRVVHDGRLLALYLDGRPEVVVPPPS